MNGIQGLRLVTVQPILVHAHAAELRSGARAQSVTGAARALDAITQACASCPHEHRWTRRGRPGG